MAKTVLIPQTTFTGSEMGNAFFHQIDDLLINANKITVVLDGSKYTDLPVRHTQEDSDEYFEYGATEVSEETFDFSEFPFWILSGKTGNGQIIYTSIGVQDSNQHTIEVYTGEDEPVVTVKKPGVQVLQLDERLIIFDETTGDIVTFDGENWLLGNDGFGTGVITPKSDYAVVGTAIVGKDVVAPSEEPEPEPQETILIPETTFTTEANNTPIAFHIFDGIEPFNYKTIKVVLDGEEMNLSGNYNSFGNFVSYGVTNTNMNIECDFGNQEVIFTENVASTHTIKVIKNTDEVIDISGGGGDAS